MSFGRFFILSAQNRSNRWERFLENAAGGKRIFRCSKLSKIIECEISNLLKWVIEQFSRTHKIKKNELGVHCIQYMVSYIFMNDQKDGKIHWTLRNFINLEIVQILDSSITWGFDGHFWRGLFTVQLRLWKLRWVSLEEFVITCVVLREERVEDANSWVSGSCEIVFCHVTRVPARPNPSSLKLIRIRKPLERTRKSTRLTLAETSDTYCWISKKIIINYIITESW